MTLIDLLLLAAIIAAAVSIIAYMRRRKKKGECGCGSYGSGACRGCPLANSCREKKKD